jgi:hypothetical protein
MITTLKAGSAYHVTGDMPYSIQEDLNFAVELARRETTQDGLHASLVTRLGPGSFRPGLRILFRPVAFVSRPWKK